MTLGVLLNKNREKNKAEQSKTGGGKERKEKRRKVVKGRGQGDHSGR